MATDAKRGRLISFEGMDCSGKGTQIKLLMEYLSELDVPAVTSHEPGGTSDGEALRKLIKYRRRALQALQVGFQNHTDFSDVNTLLKADNDERTPECELFMFLAARAEFSDKILEPLLKDGTTVVCDRLHDSTTAYQGGGRMLDLQSEYQEFIDFANRIVLRGLKPNLTFYLDIPVEVMLKRVAQQGDEKNADFEKNCKPEFFQRVRRAYLEIARREPNRFIVIDGDQPPATVFKFIRSYIDELFSTGDDVN